ncbi:MAG: hypothetical protein ACOX12_09170 [Eggerthellaceae bacterium]
MKIADSSHQRLANVPFKITSKTTGESHVIVTDANGYASTAASWNKHTEDTNGGKEGSGVWFGSSDPDDAKGALLYDTYSIEEQRCDSNADRDAHPRLRRDRLQGLHHDQPRHPHRRRGPEDRHHRDRRRRRRP